MFFELGGREDALWLLGYTQANAVNLCLFEILLTAYS